MDWNAGTDWLMRLVSLLLSLADCAERAAGRSRRVRRHVLSILRPAEAVAFRSVVNAARHYGAPIPITANVAYSDWVAAPHGDDRDDALRLAERFRALALALSYISIWANYFARRITAPRHALWRGWQFSPAGPALMYDVPALAAPDTS
jgi:hypothetical protein